MQKFLWCAMVVVGSIFCIFPIFIMSIFIIGFSLHEGLHEFIRQMGMGINPIIILSYAFFILFGFMLIYLGFRQLKGDGK